MSFSLSLGIYTVYDSWYDWILYSMYALLKARYFSLHKNLL